jgi:hypothetical protein
MGRDVLVVASGETERRSLPHLLKHLIGAELRKLVDVRISPHGRLTVPVAEKIVRAAWWEYQGSQVPIDKVVVLADADVKTLEETLRAFDDLERRLADLPFSVRVAAAKWHLEAWFFADAEGLRAWLGGRSLGRIQGMPDAIPSPKVRLCNLIAETYTSRVAESIASALSPEVIRQASPSFAGFEAAVKNGAGRVHRT